jgi:peptidoglycan/xylan/chitin deacetylase (PgdA/CDA1 family)
MGRRSVICLYHGVPKENSAVFEQHVLFLKRHFDLASPADFENQRARSQRIRVLLTFDDGFRNHAEVVAPILRRHNVPAIFFVPSRHATPGQYLWFSYLQALERHFKGTDLVFRGELIGMAGDRRRQSIERLSKRLLALAPHPRSMYDVIENELPPLEDFVPNKELMNEYGGMTAEQVGELASDPLFMVGSHTVDHPFLTRCSPDEAVWQMRENKNWLERVTNRPCNTIAYPSGDYNTEILGACPELGFSRGYATTPLFGQERELEIPRMGIYSPSVETLGFKIYWGNVMRAVGMKVG